MDRELKSTAYFFVSRGMDIYIDEEKPDSFLVSLHVCASCGEPWYMDLTQCFFCGMYNTFTYHCENCKTHLSITGAAKKCKNCGGKSLGLKCINPECPSNTDDQISEAATSKYKGVFEKKSPFSVALENCIHCGQESNRYIENRVYVYRGTPSSSISQKSLLSVDYSIEKPGVLIVKHEKAGIILYSTTKLEKHFSHEHTITISPFRDEIDMDLVLSLDELL